MTKEIRRWIKVFLRLSSLLVLVGCQPILVDTANLQNMLDNQEQATGLDSVEQGANFRFITSLQVNLANFQLHGIGITESVMLDIIQHSDFETRVDFLIDEIWSEWQQLSNQSSSFDTFSTEPSYEQHGVSPFRQLVIRMIQGRQQTLSDSQQHALHSFFTRHESDTVWESDMDGIIGAVNRESFLWP